MMSSDLLRPQPSNLPEEEFAYGLGISSARSAYCALLGNSLPGTLPINQLVRPFTFGAS